jgi:3'-5' exoribonuclease
LTKIFIKEIRDRDLINSVFLVKDKISAMAKNGKPYLTLRLMDKSGEIEGRVWDNADEVAATFAKDDFIAIRAKASVYLAKMQLIVAQLKRVPDAEVNLAEFLPESPRRIEEMGAEFDALLVSIENPWLRRLMALFQEDGQFMALYRTAPAAKGMHHVYLGGLLEHSLSVASLVDRIVPQYENLNRDLLITGALLHDVGKVREMAYARAFDYTDEGKLLGHITIGVEMIHEKILLINGFPQELGMLLKHMILSHHGQYEYGSPKRPKTIEATVLNYLDDMDSKINGIRTHFNKELDNGARWTAYHRLYDRYYYREKSHTGDVEPISAILSENVSPPVVREQSPEPVVQPPSRPTVPEHRETRPSFQNNPFAALKGTGLTQSSEES